MITFSCNLQRVIIGGKISLSFPPAVTLKINDSIFMDPCIVDYSVEIPTRCSFVIEFIIPKFFEAFKKLWNNKFYYKAASCWYFY